MAQITKPKLGMGDGKVGLKSHSLGIGGGPLQMGKIRTQDGIESALPGEKTEGYVERVLTDAQRQFKENTKKERNRWLESVDSEYWFCVCFQSREQKEEFLQKSGLLNALDEDKYLDGRLVAKHLGIKITEVDFRYNDDVRINKNLAGLAVEAPTKPKAKLVLRPKK